MIDIRDRFIAAMQFRVVETFTEGLSKLTGEEQKGVKTTAFDLQLNPANPRMQFYRRDNVRDINFWKVINHLGDEVMKVFRV